MLKIIGKTEENKRVYGLTKEYGVDESGMLLKIDKNSNSFIFTDFFIDTEITENTEIDVIKSKVLNLRRVNIDGHILNLFDFKLDNTPYIQLIKGSEDEDEVMQRVLKLPLKHQFFARNQEAKVFIHYEGNSAIINLNNKAKFHKDNTEEANKKLTAILKSISCQFENYENFLELE